MFRAIDEEKNTVYISNADNNSKYFCSGCGANLGIRAGKTEKMRRHFYHLYGNDCSYAIDHDMSEWHFQWQEQFPEQYREIPLPASHPQHRADICIGNRIIEFQHSPISEEDFNSRNQFYISNGFELTWVFDKNERIKGFTSDGLYLRRRDNLFKGYDLRSSCFALLFEIGNMLYWIDHMDEKTGRYIVCGIIGKDQFIRIFDEKKTYLKSYI